MELFTNLPNFDLWRAGGIVASSRRDNPTDPVTLHSGDALDETASNKAVEDMLVGRDPKRPPRDARAIFDALRDTDKLGNNKGLGRVAAAVLNAARPLDSGV